MDPEIGAGVATMEAARGNYKDFDALVEDGFVQGLLEAIDLRSLIPDKLEAGACGIGHSKGENDLVLGANSGGFDGDANTVSL